MVRHGKWHDKETKVNRHGNSAKRDSKWYCRIISKKDVRLQCRNPEMPCQSPGSNGTFLLKAFATIRCIGIFIDCLLNHNVTASTQQPQQITLNSSSIFLFWFCLDFYGTFTAMILAHIFSSMSSPRPYKSKKLISQHQRHAASSHIW